MKHGRAIYCFDSFESAFQILKHTRAGILDSLRFIIILVLIETEQVEFILHLFNLLILVGNYVFPESIFLVFLPLVQHERTEAFQLSFKILSILFLLEVAKMYCFHVDNR